MEHSAVPRSTAVNRHALAAPQLRQGDTSTRRRAAVYQRLRPAEATGRAVPTQRQRTCEVQPATPNVSLALEMADDAGGGAAQPPQQPENRFKIQNHGATRTQVLDLARAEQFSEAPLHAATLTAGSLAAVDAKVPRRRGSTGMLAAEYAGGVGSAATGGRSSSPASLPGAWTARRSSMHDIHSRPLVVLSPSTLHIVAIPLLILSLLATGFILVYLKDILVPFVVAMFFVYLLRPLVNFLTQPFSTCCHQSCLDDGPYVAIRSCTTFCMMRRRVERCSGCMRPVRSLRNERTFLCGAATPGFAPPRLPARVASAPTPRSKRRRSVGRRACALASRGRCTL